MRVSLEWLGEYVDISGLAPEEIAEALTGSGLEVEAVERAGGSFTNVVVARCAKLDPHPNADKLRLPTLDLGGGQTQQVVCGAPNLAEGMLVAFAKEGAQVINRKDGGLFTLGRANIRGVESAGMVCSIEELGLQDVYPPNEEGGIWAINQYVDDNQLGQDLKEALDLRDDAVLHTAPTANRGDLMSMIGVAREVAALFNRNLTLPEVTLTPPKKQGDITVALPDPGICAFYGGLTMNNIEIKPSPDWLARRLAAAGVKVINNVVDVTNYVMLETGQPLHAFDRNKLPGSGEISVRRASAGEKFAALDDNAYELTPESVVVTYNDCPVALGGVMGGGDSEIDDTSQALLLEGAYFDPAANRKSAKSVGFRTESSARFERGVDPLGVERAIRRAAQLVQELAGGEPVAYATADHREKKTPAVSLRLSRFASVIGLPVSAEEAATVLDKLGFEIRSRTADELTVAIPGWRQADVYREIDLIEEVIRIHGYDNVPYTLPKKTASVPFSPRQALLDHTRHVMGGLGLSEVMTTSLIGTALLGKTGIPVDTDQLVTVTNSHSVDHTLMRQSLVPNLLEIAKYNQAQGIDDVWVYELGRVYFKRGKANPKNSGVAERLHLGGLIAGGIQTGEWHDKPQTDFYTAKGILESFIDSLGLDAEPVFEADDSAPHLHPGKTARISLAGKALGLIGELHPVFTRRLKFRHPVYLFELDMEALFKATRQATPEAGPLVISPYPQVMRDMALRAPVALFHRQIVETIRAVNEPLLKEIHLFDEYRGDQVGEGYRSMAYRITLQSPERTLKDQDVDAAVGKIKEALKQSLGVEFR